MLTFRSSILLTGAADTPQYNTLIVVVSFLANMTVLLGVSALVERAPENLAKLSPWPFCGCILVGIAAIGGAGIWFAGPALSASLVIGSTLCGVGFGYLWGLSLIHISLTIGDKAHQARSRQTRRQSRHHEQHRQNGVVPQRVGAHDPQ